MHGEGDDDDDDDYDDNSESLKHWCVTLSSKTHKPSSLARQGERCTFVFSVQLVVRVFRVCCAAEREARGRKERQCRKQVIDTSCSSCVHTCVRERRSLMRCGYIDTRNRSQVARG